MCHAIVQMKTLTIIILLFILTSSWGQSIQTKNDKFLTYEQNENWLKKAKSLDKLGQWAEIKQRFFLKHNSNTSLDSSQYSSLILINGVPLNIPDKLTDEDSGKILSILNEDSIDQIVIVDKLSDEWIFCKPFSGVILLTVGKKTDKKLFKLKLE